MTKFFGFRGISIHPPREGWDPTVSALFRCPMVISIHPPREGWDAIRQPLTNEPGDFNPPTP